VLTPIEQRGAIDQAHRLRQRISDGFVFTIALGACGKANDVDANGHSDEKTPPAYSDGQSREETCSETKRCTENLTDSRGDRCRKRL